MSYTPIQSFYNPKLDLGDVGKQSALARADLKGTAERAAGQLSGTALDTLGQLKSGAIGADYGSRMAGQKLLQSGILAGTAIAGMGGDGLFGTGHSMDGVDNFTDTPVDFGTPFGDIGTNIQADDFDEDFFILFKKCFMFHIACSLRVWPECVAKTSQKEK